MYCFDVSIDFYDKCAVCANIIDSITLCSVFTIYIIFRSDLDVSALIAITSSTWPPSKLGRSFFCSTVIYSYVVWYKCMYKHDPL